MDIDDNRSWGVFKPVGHIVISFPDSECAGGAARALASLGLPAADIRRYTDREMLAQIDEDLQHASPLAAIGQELNLVKAHRELAERGFHWLVVRAEDDALASRIAECVRPYKAERAQQYGHFIIVELIEPGTGIAQVSESPDRGLDAQTPSGNETERADMPR